MSAEIMLGDCRDLLATMTECSVDSIVTDPPYELGFMGKAWDSSGVAYDRTVWEQAYRVLKPGGHLLAFGGSRTYHRLACAIEDAGFEIRDQIMWIYGSGFPKSLDVSKAIDKAAGAEREPGEPGRYSARRPATDEARAWQGWGTALKPAHEPIVVARKPLAGTVAANVLVYGTGALNIDGCRVSTDDSIPCKANQNICGRSFNSDNYDRDRETVYEQSPSGRWPANLIHDGSDEVLELFPQNAGGGTATRGASSRIYGGGRGFTAATGEVVGYGDGGSAARFFYCAKASRAERNAGTDTNAHPTVKPVALMRYLVRLITQPGGTVLDPFTGSGTTGIAAMLEGMRFVGIEQNAEYADIARARIAAAGLEYR